MKYAMNLHITLFYEITTENKCQENFSIAAEIDLVPACKEHNMYSHTFAIKILKI